MRNEYWVLSTEYCGGKTFHEKRLGGRGIPSFVLVLSEAVLVLVIAAALAPVE